MILLHRAELIIGILSLDAHYNVYLRHHWRQSQSSKTIRQQHEGLCRSARVRCILCKDMPEFSSISLLTTDISQARRSLRLGLVGRSPRGGCWWCSRTHSHDTGATVWEPQNCCAGHAKDNRRCASPRGLDWATGVQSPRSLRTPARCW